jgi:hypothetical protein
LEAILVEIDALPAVARAAARKDDVLLFDESETNLASTITAVRGDVELAFRNAAYTAASASRCSGTRRYRWSRADCWPSGMPRMSG